MPKNVKKRTVEKAPAEELPDWVTKTPDEIEYYLEMYDPNDEPLQHIDVSRGEFEALKQHLAKMRGIVIPKNLEVAHA